MSSLAQRLFLIISLSFVGACGDADDSTAKNTQNNATEALQTSAAEASFDPTYTEYAKLLQEYVKGDKVDYGGLRAGRKAIERIVAGFGTISRDSVASFNEDDRLAFYINAYNVITLLSVIEHYPVSSIRDIDGVWDKRKWSVAGNMVTLNDIEHNILRKQFHEPRIHFAINCASISCPPLKNIPYRAGTLKEQLSTSARDFLNNTAYAHFNKSTGVLTLSEIFSWFGEDFASFPVDPRITATLNAKEKSIVTFVASRWPETAAQELLENVRSIDFTPYNWDLNNIDR